jgi:hypothetical protein
MIHFCALLLVPRRVVGSWLNAAHSRYLDIGDTAKSLKSVFLWK